MRQGSFEEKRSPFWTSGSIFAGSKFKLTPEVFRHPRPERLRAVCYRKQQGSTRSAKKINFFSSQQQKKWLFQVADFCEKLSLAHYQSAQILPNLKHFLNLNLWVRKRPFGAGYPPSTFFYDHFGPQCFSAKNSAKLIVNIFT